MAKKLAAYLLAEQHRASRRFLAELLPSALALCLLLGLATAATAAPAGGKVIQQMTTPYEAERHKTVKYTYVSTLVGYITYRHVDEGGFYHLTTLGDQVIPILPHEGIDAAFRTFLQNAEEQISGVALTGTIIVWTDGSSEFFVDHEARYAAASADYTAAKAARQEAQKKETAAKKTRATEENNLNIRRTAESAKARELEEFETFLKKQESQKAPPAEQSPPGFME